MWCAAIECSIMQSLLIVYLVVTCTLADSEYDYEDEVTSVSAVPLQGKSKTSKLGSLLLPRNRGAGPMSIKKSSIAAAHITTSTKSIITESTTEQLKEDYEDDIEENTKQEIRTTTTETSKKLGRGSVVRPFRSNEDLLAALKRRRAQGVTNQSREFSTTNVPAETTQFKSKLQSNSRSKSGVANEVTKNTSRVRFSTTRGKSTTTAQEEAQESRSEDVQIKPKAYRRG